MNVNVFTRNGFPRVGIRPIIDGRRRGVRESLEDQTMAMAKNSYGEKNGALPDLEAAD